MFEKIDRLRSMMYNAIENSDSNESLQYSQSLDKEIVNYHKNKEDEMLKNLKRISDVELFVMQEIWSNCGRVRKVELIYIIKQKKDWQDFVLLTILEKLEKKKFIKGYYDKNDEKCYRAIIPRNIYIRMVTKDFFDTVHRNSIKSLLSSVNTVTKINENELKEIMELIRNNQ